MSENLQWVGEEEDDGIEVPVFGPPNPSPDEDEEDEFCPQGLHRSNEKMWSDSESSGYNSSSSDGISLPQTKTGSTEEAEAHRIKYARSSFTPSMASLQSEMSMGDAVSERTRRAEARHAQEEDEAEDGIEFPVSRVSFAGSGATTSVGERAQGSERGSVNELCTRTRLSSVTKSAIMSQLRHQEAIQDQAAVQLQKLQRIQEKIEREEKKVKDDPDPQTEGLCCPPTPSRLLKSVRRTGHSLEMVYQWRVHAHKDHSPARDEMPVHKRMSGDSTADGFESFTHRRSRAAPKSVQVQHEFGAAIFQKQYGELLEEGFLIQACKPFGTSDQEAPSRCSITHVSPIHRKRKMSKSTGSSFAVDMCLYVEHIGKHHWSAHHKKEVKDVIKSAVSKGQIDRYLKLKGSNLRVTNISRASERLKEASAKMKTEMIEQRAQMLRDRVTATAKQEVHDVSHDILDNLGVETPDRNMNDFVATTIAPLRLRLRLWWQSFLLFEHSIMLILTVVGLCKEWGRECTASKIGPISLQVLLLISGIIKCIEFVCRLRPWQKMYRFFYAYDLEHMLSTGTTTMEGGQTLDMPDLEAWATSHPGFSSLSSIQIWHDATEIGDEALVLEDRLKGPWLPHNKPLKILDWAVMLPIRILGMVMFTRIKCSSCDQPYLKVVNELYAWLYLPTMIYYIVAGVYMIKILRHNNEEMLERALEMAQLVDRSLFPGMPPFTELLLRHSIDVTHHTPEILRRRHLYEIEQCSRERAMLLGYLSHLDQQIQSRSELLSQSKSGSRWLGTSRNLTGSSKSLRTGTGSQWFGSTKRAQTMKRMNQVESEMRALRHTEIEAAKIIRNLRRILEGEKPEEPPEWRRASFAQSFTEAFEGARQHTWSRLRRCFKTKSSRRAKINATPSDQSKVGRKSMLGWVKDSVEDSMSQQRSSSYEQAKKFSQSPGSSFFSLSIPGLPKVDQIQESLSQMGERSKKAIRDSVEETLDAVIKDVAEALVHDEEDAEADQAGIHDFIAGGLAPLRLRFKYWFSVVVLLHNSIMAAVYVAALVKEYGTCDEVFQESTLHGTLTLERLVLIDLLLLGLDVRLRTDTFLKLRHFLKTYNIHTMISRMQDDGTGGGTDSGHFKVPGLRSWLKHNPNEGGHSLMEILTDIAEVGDEAVVMEQRLNDSLTNTLHQVVYPAYLMIRIVAVHLQLKLKCDDCTSQPIMAMANFILMAEFAMFSLFHIVLCMWLLYVLYLRVQTANSTGALERAKQFDRNNFSGLPLMESAIRHTLHIGDHIPAILRRRHGYEIIQLEREKKMLKKFLGKINNDIDLAAARLRDAKKEADGVSRTPSMIARHQQKDDQTKPQSPSQSRASLSRVDPSQKRSTSTQSTAPARNVTDEGPVARLAGQAAASDTDSDGGDRKDSFLPNVGPEWVRTRGGGEVPDIMIDSVDDDGEHPPAGSLTPVSTTLRHRVPHQPSVSDPEADGGIL